VKVRMPNVKVQMPKSKWQRGQAKVKVEVEKIQ
jgi:hypothetical protein